MEIPQTPWQLHHYRFGLAGESQADIIEKQLRAQRGRILNLGCGPQGRHVGNLVRIATQVIAADHDLGMVNAAKSDGPISNATFLVADAYHLPFSNSAIDHIVALGLLAYIKEPEVFFVELRRVVRSTGRVILTNSASRPTEPVIKAAERAKLSMLLEHKAYCPSASGDAKSRYLWVFTSA